MDSASAAFKSANSLSTASFSFLRSASSRSASVMFCFFNSSNSFSRESAFSAFSFRETFLSFSFLVSAEIESRSLETCSSEGSATPIPISACFACSLVIEISFLPVQYAFSTRFAPHMVCTRFTLTDCCNLFDFGY